jgi:hypothetical protein
MNHLPVIVEIDKTAGGGISAVLITLMRSKTGGIGRNLEHARVEFFQTDSSLSASPPWADKERPQGPGILVSKEWIYPELIPFGKAFQNIISPVSLLPDEASAFLSGGGCGKEDNRLGSIFPLDAVLQVACIWGQRFSDYVLFPIGLKKRIIHQKTKKDGIYTGRVFPKGVEKNQFFFNAWIFDDQGAACEEIRGIQMQDVSQGRLYPPLWIKDL